MHVHDMQPHRSVFDQTGITIHHGDALDHCGELGEYGNVDMVVNMLPGEIGKIAMNTLNEGLYRTVDLSFSENTPDLHDEKARDWGVSILWDVGIAPGLSNMLLAEAYRKLGPLEKAEVRVGGNPTGPTQGWNYMAPFSPKDVIAEYTRPARVIRDSEEVTLPALSERHIIDVPEHGQMEAFLTDGLRSVLNSIPAVEMSEYTIRWPGHIQMFIDERDAGTLDEDELLANAKHGTLVIPGATLDDRARVRMCMLALERELGGMGLMPPCSTYHRFAVGMTGDKMSSSHPETTIFMDETMEEMERKVKRSFSGGQPTTEEHRRLGGDCSKDVAFQYLQFFFESDDNALAEIRSEYESGRMLAGEIKQICIDKATEWLTELAERRNMWADRLDEFLAADAF